MSHPITQSWASATRPAGQLASTPAVRRDGSWWLVCSAGSVHVSDRAFTDELDRFAADLAAADRAVAEIPADQPGAEKERR
jgi:hypothetical protein